MQTVAAQEPCLAPREGRVVELAEAGFSNKAIADRMGLTEGTVKVYLSRAFQKLRVGSRYELIARRVRFLEEQLANLRGIRAGAD